MLGSGSANGPKRNRSADGDVLSGRRGTRRPGAGDAEGVSPTRRSLKYVTFHCPRSVLETADMIVRVSTHTAVPLITRRIPKTVKVCTTGPGEKRESALRAPRADAIRDQRLTRARSASTSYPTRLILIGSRRNFPPSDCDKDRYSRSSVPTSQLNLHQHQQGGREEEEEEEEGRRDLRTRTGVIGVA